MNWVSSGGAGLCLGLFLSISTADQPLLLPKVPTVVVTNANFVACKEPRPEICYEVYAPVCAIRKLATQCTLAPCLNTEQKTYANDCQACSDRKVLGFAQGGECS
ncbi:MAG: hypothetical protein E6Q83_08450 [Thiothrix sp.]|nr:MAG: hypothetical protein E6Q83_08450 [Thiothrix sp.]